MQLMDCTLRDGSYAIGFQFSSLDTAQITGELDRIGVPLIEVGHGVGLNASACGFGESAESDADYMNAAVEAAKRAKVGVFCIPGIARLQDIDLAAACGVKFIRIGTNVEDVHQSAPFVERAREKGLLVCSNLMKSYTTEPRMFARIAQTCEQFGSNVLYLVDSAGGMLPDHLTEYFRAIQDVCPLPLAFHGHDNLGLAVSNSVHAIRLGATIVDTSLQGMGRSSGNAATELLTAVLSRMGIPTGIEPLEVMDVGEKLVRPLIKRRGLRSIDVVCGLAQFHSSYMSVIRKVASKYRVDPRRLIMEVCKYDRVNAPEPLVDKCARDVKAAASGEPALTARFEFEDYFGDEQVKRAR